MRGKGKVTRGYLGVLIQKVTPEIAESLGMEKSYGALVANVSKDGPAEKAGVKVGDVIVEFDGKEVKDSGDLPIIVARTQVDKKVRMKVLRDKKEIALSVAVGELKDEEVVAAVPEKGELGLTVQRLTPQMAESLGLGKSRRCRRDRGRSRQRRRRGGDSPRRYHHRSRSQGGSQVSTIIKKPSPERVKVAACCFWCGAAIARFSSRLSRSAKPSEDR